MEKNKAFFILFFVIAVLGFFFCCYLHEIIHKVIFYEWGINSTIVFSTDSIQTIPETNGCTDYCLLAHNINEIVGYYFLVLYGLISIGIMFIIGMRCQK